MYKVTVGKEPVPFAIMFVTIEIDADIALASVCVAALTPKYCVASVTLIFAPVFGVIIIGIGVTAFLSALTNVCAACGKCLTAPVDADTNVCTDCGKCCIAFADADTNVWIEPEALPASPTFILNIPFCLCRPFEVADINVCALVYEDGPTLILNVFVVTPDILNHLPLG